MSEYNQVTNLDDLAGKTIARAMYLGDGAAIGIVFADGTYLHLDADAGCGDDLSIATCNALCLRRKVSLGVATEQEIAIKLRFDEAGKQHLKDRRRAEYERLRAEFEGEEAS